MKKLIELAKKSTESVENNNQRYYYQAGEYKFNNVHLANWYERKYNSWAAFVAQPISQIKNILESNVLDKNKDYDIEYLKKLRNENDYLQLFFSGGADSLTIFKKAIDHDIFFDEVISVTTGDTLDLPENKEIVLSAIPFAKKHKGKYGKFTIKQTTLNQIEEIYKDSYCLLKNPDLGAIFPIFRRMWWSGYQPLTNGKRIIGADKPLLLYYKNRWYTVLLDIALNGAYGIDKDVVFFKFEPDNIFSTINDSLSYREYLLEKNLVTDQKIQFFKMSNIDENNFINRNEPENKKDFFVKSNAAEASPWNKKDELCMIEAVKQQRLKLLNTRFKALEKVLKIYPDYDYKKFNLSDMKFGWFIDIDSFKAYTPDELIPNGFET